MTSPQLDPNTGRGSDLEWAVGILRRRAGLIALVAIAITAAAVGLSMLQEKQYSASASLLFRNPGFAEDLFGTAATGTANPTREVATNERLLRLEVVAARTAKRLRGLSPSEVSSMVSVSVAGEADVVSVTATSPHPVQAQRVANQFARQFIAFRAGADRSKLLQAKRLAEREYERLSEGEQEGVRGTALSRAAEKLGVLASLQTGNAELVQPAKLPSSPSSPKPLRNGILGAILGLMLGVGLAFLADRLNRKLRDPEEAGEAFGLPVVGTVPASKAIMASNQGSAATLPFAENEAFRTMRASLRYFSVDKDVRSVLVTSHAAGVGKSTVSWNLARVGASSASTVIVEADLRAPSLAAQHGLASGPGLAELLTGQVQLDEAIQSQPIAVGGEDANGAGGSIDAIVAGAAPPNPAEQLESRAMDLVLTRLGERYDLVVIDTAPLGVVSDAFPLLRHVDGTIVVARIGKTTRDSAQRLRQQLDRLDAPVLGVVANCVRLARRDRYGYGYGYDYTGYRSGGSEQPSGTAASVGSDD